jgi:hypothetical protein
MLSSRTEVFSGGDQMQRKSAGLPSATGPERDQLRIRVDYPAIPRLQLYVPPVDVVLPL